MSRLLLICLLSLAVAGCNGRSPVASIAKPSQPGATEKTNPITDLVLIYDGGQGHQPWTVDRFKPYVYREANGNFEWLFDGFLFLDPFTPSGARLCPISKRPDATKMDWQDIITHYFADGQSIAALDQLLDELEKKGHKPVRQRRVVLMLPTPITGSSPYGISIASDWGSLDGRKMDFHHEADRFQAAQWYLDEVLKRWKDKHFKHLELAGFYWLFERSWTVNHTREIGNYIHRQGGFFYWIPSWPQGRANWKELGFDFVYQQPNYFFHRKPTPSNRLEQACQFAKRCGTSMEMEFNKDLLNKPGFPTYFDEYLRAYAKHNVWEKKPVAYYEGAGAWADMAQSHDPAVKSRYKSLGDIIVKRQKQADAGFVFRQGLK